MLGCGFGPCMSFTLSHIISTSLGRGLRMLDEVDVIFCDCRRPCTYSCQPSSCRPQCYMVSPAALWWLTKRRSRLPFAWVALQHVVHVLAKSISSFAFTIARLQLPAFFMPPAVSPGFTHFTVVGHDNGPFVDSAGLARAKRITLALAIWLFAWLYAWLYAWLCAWLYAWLYTWLYACRYACLYACLYAWLYGCIYAWL